MTNEFPLVGQACGLFSHSAQPHCEVRAVLDEWLFDVRDIKGLSRRVVTFCFKPTARTNFANNYISTLYNTVHPLYRDGLHKIIFRFLNKSLALSRFRGHNAFLHYCVKTGVMPKKFYGLVAFVGDLNLKSYNKNISPAYSKFVKELCVGVINKNKAIIAGIINDLLDTLVEIANLKSFYFTRQLFLLNNALLAKAAQIQYTKHAIKYNFAYYNMLLNKAHGVDFEMAKFFQDDGGNLSFSKKEDFNLTYTNICALTNMFAVEPSRYLSQNLPRIPASCSRLKYMHVNAQLRFDPKVKTVFPLQQVPMPHDPAELSEVLAQIGSTFRFPNQAPNLIGDEVELDTAVLRWRWQNIFKQDNTDIIDTSSTVITEMTSSSSHGADTCRPARRAKSLANISLFNNIEHANSISNTPSASTSDIPKQLNFHKFVPFSKNKNKLPSCPDPVAEEELISCKRDMLTSIKQYAPTPLQTKLLMFRKRIEDICKQNKLIIVGSDKTKRTLLLDREVYVHLGEMFLSDTLQYAPATMGDVNKTLQLSHQLLKKVGARLRVGTSQKDKLLQYDAKPANMSFLIKDHKNPVSTILANGEEINSYPLRPIASVHGTAMDTIDWILQPILTELAKLVPANLEDAAQFIQSLEELPPPKAHCTYKYFSLDVVNLYPSVPVDVGVRVVTRLLNLHPEVDLFGLHKEDVVELLNGVCYNYYVGFNNKVYHQEKGVPMGARFAPPFAIILMHHIETLALAKLPIRLKPKLYYRYIDDIIMVLEVPSTASEASTTDKVLETFNAVHRNIQFTLETPDEKGKIAFLDTLFWYNGERWVTQWYQKALHSGNMVNALSHLPERAKFNILVNRFRNVVSRTNSQEGLSEGIARIARQMIWNGYTRDTVNSALWAYIRTQRAPTNNKQFANRLESGIMCRLPFYSQTITDQIQRICRMRAPGNNQLVLIQKKSTDLRQVTNSNTNVAQCAGGRNAGHCPLCPLLPRGVKCSRRGVIYQFACKQCDALYIGKTNTTIRERVLRHSRDLNQWDVNSPLVAHLRVCVNSGHSGVNSTLEWDKFFTFQALNFF